MQTDDQIFEDKCEQTFKTLRCCMLKAADVKDSQYDLGFDFLTGDSPIVASIVDGELVIQSDGEVFAVLCTLMPSSTLNYLSPWLARTKIKKVIVSKYEVDEGIKKQGSLKGIDIVSLVEYTGRPL